MSKNRVGVIMENGFTRTGTIIGENPKHWLVELDHSHSVVRVLKGNTYQL